MEDVIEPDSLDGPCGCGEMHKIGEDRSERLAIVPAQLRVIVRSCAAGRALRQETAATWLRRFFLGVWR
jgi:transposase